MKKAGKRRLVIWGSVGLVALLLLIWAMAPRPQLVDTVRVERGPLRVTLDHEGKTRVRDRFVVSSPLAGRVLRIEAEPGDAVVAGETLLATLEPSEPVLLDARSRAQAEAQVAAARAALEQARAERQRAEAESDLAATELLRIRRLAGDGIVSQEALDQAAARAESAAEAATAAAAAVRTALGELEAANAMLLEPGDGSGSRRLGTLALRSPVDGVVLRRYQESEAVVPAGEPLLEVADPQQLEIIADYLSADAVKMRPGMPAEIHQWGGEHELAARVRRVEPSGFLKISALGVEEQRVWVVLDLDAPYEEWASLGDGYRVEVRVIVWRDEAVLKAPTSSLFRHGDAWAVFAVDRGEARLREVEVGRRNGLAAQILSGLEEGERVIVHPPDSVGDGVAVEVHEMSEG